MEFRTDYSNVGFQNNGKLKLLIIVGTRPEIIRLAAVINKTRQYFDVILAHTGQNYDYNLNGVFFKDLKLKDPEVYMDAVGDDLGATMGNIINASYKLMVQTQPDAVLVLGDTNSCLSVIGAKRLHIPIFHMEAGNRCKDECLPEETNRRIVDIISDVNLAYSEHARRYLAECGLPRERTYVTGSPMAEVLHQNLAEIEASDIHQRLGLEKGKYILLSAHREENIDTEKNFFSLFNAINAMAEKYDMPILYSCHPRSRNRLATSGFHLDPRVQVQQPLGFHDYNCLQMNAFAVVSDSGTLPEESSFFTSVGHPFPAICIRTSTERPESLDKAGFILSGIDTNGAGPAADAAFFVHGGDARRLGVVGVPAHHLDRPGRAMARTVVATDAVGVDHAILRNPHGMADLDRRFPGEVGQADGARGAHLGALRALRTAVSALERHFGLHEGHQLARRTQHLIGTHRNTQLASRAMGVEVPQALRSGRNDGRGTVRNLLVDDHRQPAVDLLLLRPERGVGHDARQAEEPAARSVGRRLCGAGAGSGFRRRSV